jgi:large repetitive protein
MAILLTDLTAQTAAVNIAVVPGTTTPICVTTIMNSDYGSGCSSQNQSFFGNFYADTPNIAPVGLNGVTVPLTAGATVVPGHTYHLHHPGCSSFY